MGPGFDLFWAGLQTEAVTGTQVEVSAETGCRIQTSTITKTTTTVN